MHRMPKLAMCSGLSASAAFGAAFVLFADTIAKVTGAGGLPMVFIRAFVRRGKGPWA